MKMLSLLVGAVLVVLAFDSYGGSLDTFDNSEKAVAVNFADAIQDKDVVLGVFEVPDDASPTVLPSGDYLENIPGYSEALLQNGLCLLKSVESLHGEAPAFVFVSQLPVRVEREPYAPFIALPGSRWILALQKHTNDIAVAGGVDKRHESIDIVRQNMAKLFNGNRGAACLEWPKEKGVEQPRHVVNVNSTVLNDIRRIRNHQAVQKGTRDRPTEDSDNVQDLLESEFGKSMYQRIANNELHTPK
jgi:hypothetical protein